MRKLILAIVLIVFIITLVSCSPSVGRKVIEKDNFEVNLSLGGSFYYYTPLPLPLPNIGFGLRYGVYDNINIGLKVYPILSVLNTLQFSPYIVGSILKSTNHIIPSINGYIELNSLMHFNPLDIALYPLVGICSIWSIKPVNLYVPLETSFDFYSERRIIKFNIGIGAEVEISKNISLSGEFRINSIGNIYLPLGNMVGVPVFFIEGTYKF